MRSFAASDYGQSYHDLLCDMGRTADEWGELPPDVRHFHEQAHAEAQRRRSEEIDKMESQMDTDMDTS